jgi:hypothetical protein
MNILRFSPVRRSIGYQAYSQYTESQNIHCATLDYSLDLSLCTGYPQLFSRQIF